MKHPRRDQLTDLALCAEIELLTDLILAVGHSGGRLSEDELDAALGLSQPVASSPAGCHRPQEGSSSAAA